jgi:hypothetical protein
MSPLNQIPLPLWYYPTAESYGTIEGLVVSQAEGGVNLMVSRASQIASHLIGSAVLVKDPSGCINDEDISGVYLWAHRTVGVSGVPEWTAFNRCCAGN